MITNSKIPLSQILSNNKIAIKVTSAEQAKFLVPDYSHPEDLEMFFQLHKSHYEFVSAGETGFYFQSPENKEVIDFEEVEFDIKPSLVG